MKNIRFFPTLNEYRTFIYRDIIKTPEFQAHPFYRGLTAFIIDHRVPFFFEASDDCEYAHFTQYFNFVLMRDTYLNDSVRDMFFMHDFVHMAFDNPLEPHRHDFDYFAEIANFNEYVASNETEVLTYYRLPGLREKSHDYPILYDLLAKRSSDVPTVAELFDLRRAIVLDNQDAGFGNEENAERIFSFLRKFKENNQVWCRVWYDNFKKLPLNYSNKRLCLPIMGYDEILPHYVPQATEEHYRAITLQNVRVALGLAGFSDLPTRFEECEAAIQQLEGKIIMEDTARVFHNQYMANKNA